MIVAHGNGTRASDASEVQAPSRVQSIRRRSPIQAGLGHLIAASGTLDLPLTL
jgi:3-oxoacyl-(acyl-carrier-protein) synthase